MLICTTVYLYTCAHQLSISPETGMAGASSACLRLAVDLAFPSFGKHSFLAENEILDSSYASSCTLHLIFGHVLLYPERAVSEEKDAGRCFE